MSTGDFSADYFDGHTSRRRPVLVEVAGEMLAIRGDGVFVDVPREKANFLPRLGETPLRIGLPGGDERVEQRQRDTVDQRFADAEQAQR